LSQKKFHEKNRYEPKGTIPPEEDSELLQKQKTEYPQTQQNTPTLLSTQKLWRPFA
jgi:hypothetical protein